MLTARALCLAVEMLLLASCGNEPNRILSNISIPPGMRAVIIIVKQDISAAPGDHVDLLAMDKGVEVIVLQNVEVVTRDENIVQFLVSPEDAHLIEQAVERGQRFHLRKT
jgi:Flp pilus assembly protein CpaB